MSVTLHALVFALLGGLAPALIWLYFLLREDARCPEPRHVIIIALMAGMLAVLVSIPFEHLAIILLPALEPAPGLPILLSWAITEEAAKFLLALCLVLWRREVNESIDFVIYMITVALGFAALENILFLIAPFADGHLASGLATENLRFIGSTLVHVVSSSLVGFALALTYTKHRAWRVIAVLTGLILAVALHTIFNFLIILKDSSYTTTAFVLVWFATIIFLGLFEVLKYFRYRRLPKNTC